MNKNYKFYNVPQSASFLLNGTQFLLLAYLINEFQKKNYKPINPSIYTICKYLNITDGTLSNATDRLIELNLIRMKSGSKSGKNNIYSINIEKIIEYDKMSTEQLFALREVDPNYKVKKLKDPVDNSTEELDDPFNDNDNKKIDEVSNAIPVKAIENIQPTEQSKYHRQDLEIEKIKDTETRRLINKFNDFLQGTSAEFTKEGNIHEVLRYFTLKELLVIEKLDQCIRYDFSGHEKSYLSYYIGLALKNK